MKTKVVILLAILIGIAFQYEVTPRAIKAAQKITAVFNKEN